MKKGLTEIAFILDRSGSMSGLESDTIGGYNSMLAKQKEEEGEAVWTTVLFDDRVERLHDRISLEKVNPITSREYYVRGCTALLDAIGATIHHIGRTQKELPEDQRPEKTIFIITTDGMENASREYDYEKVKKMIEKKKAKHHWEFIFLGANIDAVQVAHQFGVAANRAVRYESDSEGTRLNYDVMSRMVSCARRSESAGQMEDALDQDDLLAPIREHFQRRHKKDES